MGYSFFKFLGSLVAVVLLSIVMNPDWRNKAHAKIAPNERIILAITHAPLEEKGSPLQILKVKTRDGIYIEVYGVEEKNGMVLQKLVSAVKLPDKKDGYFSFNNQVTNLAIDDIDNDQKAEILTTSFDQNLVAHLNVYKYVKGERTLQLVKLN